MVNCCFQDSKSITFYTFNSDKARKDFGIISKYDSKEAKDLTVEYFRASP